MRNRITLIILLFFIISIPLIAEESKTLSIVDIMLKLEEIEQKLHEMEQQDNVKPAQKWQIGLFPATMRFYTGFDPLSDYIDDLGEFGMLNNYLMPYFDNAEVSIQYRLTDNLDFGLKAYSGITTAKGFNDLVAANSEFGNSIDTDNDGLNDNYRYISYYNQSLSIFGLYRFTLKDPFSVFLGASFGFGSENIFFSNIDDTYWNCLFGRNEKETSWLRTYLSAGAVTGMEIRFKSWALLFQVGYDYHFPLSDWDPQQGLQVDSLQPPEDFNSMNFWISINPTFIF